jgi:hypothetical protein
MILPLQQVIWRNYVFRIEKFKIRSAEVHSVSRVYVFEYK